MKYSIAVIGATGNVGREILNILENSKVQIEKIFAVASQKSVGKEVFFKNRSVEVKSIEGFDFTDIDFVFFATNTSISKEYVPKASKKVKLLIDLSSHFRMNEVICVSRNLKVSKYHVFHLIPDLLNISIFLSNIFTLYFNRIIKTPFITT